MDSTSTSGLVRMSMACLFPVMLIAGSFSAPGSVVRSGSAASAGPVGVTATAPSAQAAANPVARTQARCDVPADIRNGSRPNYRIAYRVPANADQIAANLECLVNGASRSGRWGIMVVSLTRGDTLFARSEGSQFLPASTQKLLTAAIALDQLGADYQFHTNVMRAGAVDSLGVLHGDLIIRGDGDPAFSNKFGGGDAGVAVNALAQLVRDAGITGVTGNLMADPFAFDSTLVPDGWLNRYLDAPYAARVSALSLNENVASIVIAPGEMEDAAPVMIDPPASSIVVNSTVRTVAGSRGSSIAVRKVNSATIEARGWIGSRAAPRRIALVVEDPAIFTAGAFRSALDMSGVRVGGSTVIARTPADAEHVTSLPSPPISQLVTAMNRESINHYAELIFRNAGRGADGLFPGSAAAGFSRLSDFLSVKVGIEPGAVYSVDGSGLSVLNRVTPRAMVQLLSYAHSSPWASVFHASLPLAGRSATLSGRMRNSPAQGNLHAKTGTTSEVISLAGYVTAENGELLAFAFLYNGTDRDRARSTIDEMGIALAGLARR